ncbi:MULTISPECIES: pro-sigmaK processing inhibitor BofA family protein [Clostridium]|jgi:SigmaK-factor processing regulatory protein BofA.|nr:MULTISPECIES: pro-sigmaK processing inhibitor BofA family protein [Clostridium]AJH02073.1 pro-sigmaK processing inhibitor BofA [Clostridium beijerinckii]ALB43922.1 pro-sigmaK processing inhibitor BofA [Clostridium beijerinckii NRRL B-598]AQS07814.1 sigmaK-factor processing regulatory protein BofA [Clostridium beijerinckii]AVK48863.1 pro-sigmaK processing inhibitor BofA [Clostridium sp. MF28]MBA2887285.1 inhibitor of the pro-sigma K processing machinery [Clostridium beijerinckii]
MEGQYLIYGLAGIILLFLMIRLLKWPIKILINGIIGVVILYLANFIIANLGLIGINVNFSLAINPITALIAGFFGVPGVIVLIIIRLFL